MNRIHEILKQMIRPRVLHCVNQRSISVLRPRIDLEAKHRVYAPLPDAQLLKITNPVLRALYSFSNGLVLFESSAIPEDSANGRLNIITFESIDEYKRDLLSTLDIGVTHAQSLGTTYPDADVVATRQWVKSLTPIAHVRGSGDMLALSDKDNSCVILDIEILCCGVFDTEDFERTWPSLEAYLEDFNDNTLDFIVGWYEYHGKTSEPYFVESISDKQ
jgi:hypothetical protein